MTKYSEEFKKEVRDCHRKGMLLKQYKHDKIHTTKDVADKFGLTVEQTKNILYQKKFPNPTKYWGNKKGIHKHRPVASEWKKPSWSKSIDDFKGKFIDDPKAEEYDKYGRI
jgi:hypothetical protein|tara:strand:- start:2598 stop:2930 length:333 start_codon:yes stop_codon:yes gene_type:complete